MSLAFVLTHFFGRRNALKWLLEDYVKLPDRLWNYQTLVLGIVFFLSGTTNIIVAYTFSEQTWVFYKAISWIVWPVLSTLVLGMIFWMEHRRSGINLLHESLSVEKNLDSDYRDQESTK